MSFLSVNSLKKDFIISQKKFREKKIIHAVNDISFAINEGDVLGIVGESGSGKSTLGRCILRLIEPTEGNIYLNNQNLLSLRGEALRTARKTMQMVFQDSYSSLNPRMSIGKLIEEPIKYNGEKMTKEERKDKVLQLLEEVGLEGSCYYDYPLNYSGGQRQRIGIARALSLNPKFLIADEPVSALDVSVQAQIINLFVKLREDRGLTYIFISHDLNVVKHLCNKIAVMYLGEIVEFATCKELFQNPCHPYTKALISAIPEPIIGKSKSRIILSDDIPSPANLPEGCHFHTRCQYCMNICKKAKPSMQIRNGHQVMCHLFTKDREEKA